MNKINKNARKFNLDITLKILFSKNVRLNNHLLIIHSKKSIRSFHLIVKLYGF